MNVRWELTSAIRCPHVLTPRVTTPANARPDIMLTGHDAWISMNVTIWKSTDVNNSASTSQEVFAVDVTVGTHWTPTTEHAATLMSVSYHCVNKGVSTLKGATCVSVHRDTKWLQTDIAAKISMNARQITETVISCV